MNKKICVYIAIGAIAFLGAFGTVYIAVLDQIAHEKLVKQKIIDQVDEFVGAIKQQYLGCEAILKGCSGLIKASEYVSKKEWFEFCRTFETSREFSSIYWIGYIRYLDGESSIDSFIQNYKQKESSEYKIWPQFSKNLAAPFAYVYPNRYDKLLGYNVFSALQIKKDLQEKINEKELFIISGDKNLLGGNQNPTFLFFRPLLTQKSDLLGWVVVSVDYENIVNNVIKEFNFSEINIKMQQSNNAANDLLVLKKGNVFFGEAPLVIEKTLFMGNKEWIFSFTISLNQLHLLYPTKVDVNFIWIFLLTLVLIFCVYFAYRKTFTQEQDVTSAFFCTPVINSIDCGVIATDLSGKILLFNHKAEKILGYKADEMIEKMTPEVFHDKDEMAQRAKELTESLKTPVNPNFETFIALAEKGIPDKREWTYIRKDLTRVRVFLSVSKIFGDEMQTIGYLGFVELVNSPEVKT